jgi:hypothetical protein
LVVYFRFVYAVPNLWDLGIHIILLIFALVKIWNDLNGTLAKDEFHLFGANSENSNVGIISGFRRRDYFC